VKLFLDTEWADSTSDGCRLISLGLVRHHALVDAIAARAGYLHAVRIRAAGG
jgi:hypothetical protein